jgi:hypothetical protein
LVNAINATINVAAPLDSTEFQKNFRTPPVRPTAGAASWLHRLMEAKMNRDDEERYRARQDLLEAVTTGFSGPVCAPMPGVLLEMLEITAMQRQLDEKSSTIGASSSMALLTPTKNSSRMASITLRTSKVVAYVARRLGSYFGAGRLPA